MPTPEEIAAAKKAAEDTATSSQLTEERVVEIVKASLNESLNPAITGHLKRFGSQMEKTIADIVGKSISSLAPKQETETPPDTNAQKQKPDPEIIKLKEQLEKIQQVSEANAAKAREVELASKKEKSLTAIKEALGTKGITGSKARLVINDLVSTGAVRFDEEGNAIATVRRSRSKGTQPADIEYALRDGTQGWLEDWEKSEDAAIVLPPPTPATPARPGYGQPGGTRRGPVTYDKPAQSEQEALRRAEEMLINQGVDIAAAFRR